MTGLVVVIIVAVLIVVAGAGFLLSGQARSQRLRRQFGPEYDRTVERTGDRKAAERELLDRKQQYQELDIRPLDPEARERYRQQWTTVQEQFVDTPEAAVESADQLVTSAMSERGYPTENFDQQAALLSVEHGRTLDHYRRAHDISSRATVKEATTEDLRQAMMHYRALFEDLLSVPKDQRSAGPEPHEPQPTDNLQHDRDERS
ncbi:MAG: hypothetical protein ABIQ26_04120 [Streptosporangiaceae bacterium]